MPQCERIAHRQLGLRTGAHPSALLQADRRDDVALLAVGVLEQRDASGPVRVVLDRDDTGRHAQLVALPVDDAVHALVAAATMAHGDPAKVVAPAGLLERLEERALRFLALRQLLERRDAHASATG
jgi:hypothetical protein